MGEKNRGVQPSLTQMELISKIYDLPMHPEKWPDVLDEFSRHLGATLVGVIGYDPVYAEQQISVTTSNFDESFITEYQQQFSHYKPSPFAKLAAAGKRGFMSDLEMLDLETVEEYRQRPAMQWLNKNYGLLHGMASCLNFGQPWTDILITMFEDNRGKVTPQELETGNLFLDHFAKSTELSRAFGVLKSRFNGVFTALDRFNIGIFILSTTGAVVLKNREAERILDSADGLTVDRSARLRPLDDFEREGLKEAVAQAVQTVQQGPGRAETLLTLSRRSGKDPYLVEVSPIRDDEEIEERFKGCLVFVIDPTETERVSTDGMQTLYSLTKSETEVCKMLAEGLETEDIAESRNITCETVRNYVKQILQKTGVRNRSQLIRLALNVNLPIDLPSEEK